MSSVRGCPPPCPLVSGAVSTAPVSTAVSAAVCRQQKNSRTICSSVTPPGHSGIDVGRARSSGRMLEVILQEMAEALDVFFIPSRITSDILFRHSLPLPALLSPFWQSLPAPLRNSPPALLALPSHTHPAFTSATIGTLSAFPSDTLPASFRHFRLSLPTFASACNIK